MNKIKMVRKEGGSRVLSVSEIIPKNWTAVETEITKETKTAITVIIKRIK